MFDVATVTHGHRARCEDRVDVIQHPKGVVLVVADGAGGSGGGSEAADAVLLWIRAHVTNVTDILPAAQWAELLAKADAQMSSGRGETTAVVVAITSEGLSGASVGDSAAWVITRDSWENLTSAQNHKPLVGTGRAKPVCFERSTLSDETLVVASDGLVKYASPTRICEIVRLATDLHAGADALVDAVRLRSGELQDDVAVIVCRKRAGVASSGRTTRKRYTLTDDAALLEQDSD